MPCVLPRGHGRGVIASASGDACLLLVMPVTAQLMHRLLQFVSPACTTTNVRLVQIQEFVLALNTVMYNERSKWPAAHAWVRPVRGGPLVCSRTVLMLHRCALYVLALNTVMWQERPEWPAARASVRAARRAPRVSSCTVHMLNRCSLFVLAQKAVIQRILLLRRERHAIPTEGTARHAITT